MVSERGRQDRAGEIRVRLAHISEIRAGAESRAHAEAREAKRA